MTRAMNYQDLVEEALLSVPELFPSDLLQILEQEDGRPLLLDVREPAEYGALHIPDSLNVPRGVIEPAADAGYDETEPRLIEARHRQVVVICRSGRRSALAGRTLQRMGFHQVHSLKLGLKGWNADGGPLRDGNGHLLDGDAAEALLEGTA